MAGITTYYTPPNRIGDVFGLATIYERQLQNIESGNFYYWNESATYGYYGGGPSLNTISRLDFSNEIVSDPNNNLPSIRNEFAATPSSSYGYFGGGTNPASPTIINTISRLDFSNETVSNPNKNLLVGRRNLASTASSSYGYFGGGDSLADPSTNTISRLDFSTETVSDPGKNLLSDRNGLAATSSNSYGYFGGGLTSPPAPTTFNTITRLDFSTETVSEPGNNLPSSRQLSAATSSNSYGYFSGGVLVSTNISTMSRLDFSNETVSNPNNNLPERRKLDSTASSSYGYFGGGSGPTTTINTISRLDFSNETTSNPGRNLSTGRDGLAAVSGGKSVLRDNKTYGYFVGGNTGTYLSETITSNITKFDFSSEVRSDSNKYTTYVYLTTLSNNSYGYFCNGGFSGGPTGTSQEVLARFDLLNETYVFTNIASNIIQDTYKLAATSSNSYGYIAGGRYSRGGAPTFLVSDISRLDFSDDSVNNRLNLPIAIVGLSAISNNSNGYFSGGYAAGPSPSSNMYTLNFSNETISTSNLPFSRTEQASCSNNNYGYFAGGTSNAGEGNPGVSRTSNIWRLDFSNTTTSVLPPASNLSAELRYASATASNNYGYFAGGDILGTPFGAGISTINRLDFSTEVRSSPGNLGTTLFGSGALSNSN